MPARSEFGGLDRLIREAMAAPAGGPPKVSFGTLLRTSYGSLAGRSLVGLGLVIAGAFVVLELLASGDDGLLPFAAAGVAFAVFLVAVPALPARRAWATIRDGVRARADVTEVTFFGPGDATTIDSIKNGLARGRLRLRLAGPVDHAFETDAPWAGELRIGTELMVVVHREDGRLLTILGPAAGTIPRQ